MDRPTFAILGLALADAALLAVALQQGAGETVDGAIAVTTGYNVALSIAVVLASVGILGRFRGHRRLRAQVQAFALAAVGLHALGHLARLYYRFWIYDDLLHVFITLVAAVLGVRAAQALGVFPPRHSTRVRAGLLAVLVALAVAGAWEIFEFSMDRIQGTREQDDLADTMQDMIDGTVGGLLAAAWFARWPRPRKAGSRI